MPQLKEADYKVTRIREMAKVMDSDSILRSQTVNLIAMLILEDGTLTAERRHDCINGVCYAFGIQGHHICHRGTPLVSQAYGKPQKYYCYWREGKSPQQRFEEEYPQFSTNWTVQFEEYTLRMKNCLQDKYTINQCIQKWNPNEVGRISKVKRYVPYVLEALGW